MALIGQWLSTNNLLAYLYYFYQVGSGYTVEGQKTGEGKYGGLQIEVIPVYKRNQRKWLTGLAAKKYMWTLGFCENPLFFNEMRIPAELSLGLGDTLRMYPSEPTFWKSTRVSDMGNSSRYREIKVEVKIPKDALTQRNNS